MSTTLGQTKIAEKATILPMAHVTTRPQTKLALLMDRAGISQAELARLADTTRQQVNKYRAGARVMSPRWAKRFAPHLGVDWIALISDDPAQNVAAGVEDRVAVRELDPEPGDPINDWDEARILAMWRRLTITKKATFWGRLGFEDEMPSLIKSN